MLSHGQQNTSNTALGVPSTRLNLCAFSMYVHSKYDEAHRDASGPTLSMAITHELPSLASGLAIRERYTVRGECQIPGARTVARGFVRSRQQHCLAVPRFLCAIPVTRSKKVQGIVSLATCPAGRPPSHHLPFPDVGGENTSLHPMAATVLGCEDITKPVMGFVECVHNPELVARGCGLVAVQPFRNARNSYLNHGQAAGTIERIFCQHRG